MADQRTTYVAMLRAVNVGGATVSMAALRALATELGYADVATHLNSGNLLFGADSGDAAAHGERLGAALGELVGRPVPVLIRTPAQLELALATARRHFPHSDETLVVVAFLDRSAAGAPRDALGEWAVEEYVIGDAEVFLHYPNGQGRSKLLVTVIEKKLGVVATVRGIKTVAGLISRASG